MCSIRDFFPIDYRVGGAKPKKNFMLENRRYVTKLAKSTQASKENKNPSYIQKFKPRHGPKKQSIPENSKTQVHSIDLDKIDASLKSIRSMLAKTKITREKLGTHYEKVSLAFRDQATQTVNPYDEEEILKGSIIRYPKLKNSDMAKTSRIIHVNSIAVQTESPEFENYNSVSRKDLKSLQQDNIHSKENKPNSVKFKENHQPGEIPKYLKNRKALKEKNEKETQKKLAIRHELGLDDPGCPPGHILLPELERLEHLAKIKNDYSRLVMQLNMLPVSSDSYKMKEKRKNLEKEMDKLQLGIKLFSRQRLYVKANPKFTKKYD